MNDLRFHVLSGIEHERLASRLLELCTQGEQAALSRLARARELKIYFGAVGKKGLRRSRCCFGK